ncbi:hypothetical protein [Phenylobacterium sp.]|uniref:hypothetical protein n=1 Tax=Phenylobacterium sp. TaxID=1871053 RepID=UPI002FC67BA3
MRARFRMKASGYASATAAAATASFTASQIENGAVEDVLIGTVVVTGYTGAFTVVLDSTFSGLIKAVGDKIYTGAVPTNGQGTLAISGHALLTDTGATPTFSDTCTIISPAFEAVPFGTTAFGSWAETDPAALGIGQQGDPAAPGYDDYAIAGWGSPSIFNRLFGTEYLTICPWKDPTVARLATGDFRGIKEVYVGADDPGVLANWLKIETTANHPVYQNNGFIAPIRSADKQTSGKSEVRAIAVPWVGRPFVLQGIPDPINDDNNGLSRVNWSDSMWSLQIGVDKTGTAMPHGVVYWDPTSGSDAADGLTDSTPVLTGDVAITKLKAQHAAQGFSGTNVGGGTIYVCAGVTHAFGVNTPPATPHTCDGLWLTIRPAPGLTSSQVRFTSCTAQGFYAEKVQCIGFERTCKFVYGKPGGFPNTQTYGASREIDVVFNGGDGVDVNGQTTGVMFAEFGNGFTEHVNTLPPDQQVTAPQKHSTQWNLTRTTLGLNFVPDGFCDQQDVWGNAKVLIKCGAKNGFDLPGGSHVDTLQYFRSPENGSYIRQVVVEDYDATDGTGSQLLLVKDGIVKDAAFVRTHLTLAATAPANTNAAYFMSDIDAQTGPDLGGNVLFMHPRISGGVQLWPQTLEIPNVRVVMEAGQSGGGLETTFRYGKMVFHPGDTTEPEVGLPVADAMNTLFGSNLLSRWNARTQQTVLRDSAESVSGFLNSIVANSTLIPVTGRAAPIFDPIGLDGVLPTVDLNGDNTTSTSGSTLYHSTAPSSIRANNPVEVFMLINQRELASQTSNRRVLAYGSSTNNGRSLLRVVSGGVNKAQWGIGTNAAPVYLTAPGDFSNVCVLHFYYTPTGQAYGVGLFNAADSAYGENNYTRGTVVGTVNTGSTRFVVGGDVSSSGGNQNSWWKGGVNDIVVVNRVCTEAERQSAVEYLLSLAVL